jgi:hypothetical protein
LRAYQEYELFGRVNSPPFDYYNPHGIIEMPEGWSDNLEYLNCHPNFDELSNIEKVEDILSYYGLPVIGVISAVLIHAGATVPGAVGLAAMAITRFAIGLDTDRRYKEKLLEIDPQSTQGDRSKLEICGRLIRETTSPISTFLVASGYSPVIAMWVGLAGFAASYAEELGRISTTDTNIASLRNKIDEQKNEIAGKLANVSKGNISAEDIKKYLSDSIEDEFKSSNLPTQTMAGFSLSSAVVGALIGVAAVAKDKNIIGEYTVATSMGLALGGVSLFQLFLGSLLRRHEGALKKELQVDSDIADLMERGELTESVKNKHAESIRRAREELNSVGGKAPFLKDSAMVVRFIVGTLSWAMSSFDKPSDATKLMGVSTILMRSLDYLLDAKIYDQKRTELERKYKINENDRFR